MKNLPVAATIATLVLAASAFAAPPKGMDGSSASAAMAQLTKVLGGQAFSGRAVMTTTQNTAGGRKSRSPMTGPMEFLMTVSGEKTRTEMDFGKMMGGEMGAMPGMDKMISISRPDKKVIYQIIPGMRAYCEMPIPEAQAAAGNARVDRKVEGSETVETYVCDKVRNTITASDGTVTEVLTWETKQLGGMPIKTEIETPEGKMTTVFKDIKTGQPADSVFEPPAGYAKYGSMQELMMSGMMKMMPGRQ